MSRVWEYVLLVIAVLLVTLVSLYPHRTVISDPYPEFKAPECEPGYTRFRNWCVQWPEGREFHTND